MQTTQHSNPRCPVYLHPAAATSPAAVERIQRNTGLLVIVNLGRVTMEHAPAIVIADDHAPWGGDAA
jgi:hypothetical protein